MIFEEIRKYFNKYTKQPSIEALGIELNGRNDIAEEQLKSAMESLEIIEKDYKDDTVTTDMNWLMVKSEKFCQDKALYNAIINSIAIFDENKTTKETKDAIPSILADALGVSFDVHIGHDYIDNADERFKFYRKKEKKIPFDLEYFNKITGGGIPRKTLNIAMAGTGVGKSLFMCHMAASCLSENKNVLYITLEMAEERIAERIDANLMNVTMDTLKEMPKTSYEKKIGKLRDKIKGKLIIKEYPTATASVNNFRALLNELKIKRGFVPDILFMDYLNLCVSSRYRNNISAGSYFVVKAIAEELRGLAVEEDIAIFSATQLNRAGFMSTDVGLEDTSECIYVKEKIQLRDGTIKEIGDVKVGEQIIANDEYKTVQLVHHKKMKNCFKIKTKLGKEIIVSEDHVFPTNNGRMSLKSGLKIGSKLNTI